MVNCTMKKKSVLELFLSYMVVAGFIFNCNSMWKNATNTSKFVLPVFAIMIGAMLVLVMLKSYEEGNRLPKRSILFSFFLIAYGAIYCLVMGQVRNVLPLILTMIISVFLIDLYDEEGFPKILYCYKTLMIFIAASSLFFWIFGSILHVIKANSYVISAWDGFASVPNYYGVYFEAHRNAVTFLGNITQNTSVFTEPPMAAVNFCFALLFTFFEKYNPKVKRQRVMLILSIISTVSVLGLIFLAILYFVKVFDGRGARYNFNTVIKYLLSVLFTIVLIYAGYFIISDKLGSASGVVRLDDYKAGYQAWKVKPIFGYGLGDDKPIQQYMSAWRISNMGNSSPIMAILTEVGIYGLSLYVYAIVGGIYRAFKTKKTNLIMLMCFICLIIVSCLIEYAYIFLFLLIWVNRSKSLKQLVDE